jgi:hypothetical protein
MIGFLTLVAVVILANIVGSFVSRPDRTNKQQQDLSKDTDV